VKPLGPTPPRRKKPSTTERMPLSTPTTAGGSRRAEQGESPWSCWRDEALEHAHVSRDGKGQAWNKGRVL
jgi:hypothetical protein